MEKSDALLFLGISHVDEVEEAYELKVFEWKNFFVNRFPIPSLFRKKIQQLEKLELANAILTGLGAPELQSVGLNVSFEATFKESFHQYSEQRALLKSKLFGASKAVEIVSVVQGLIDLTMNYAAVWHDETLDISGVVVSKEPDPMDLLEAIKDAESVGVHNISQINDLPEGHLVLNEAKRLSLLYKMNHQ